MKDDKKVSHILQLYLQWPVFLTALVILAGAAVNLISRKAGFVMLAFTVIYAACAGTLYMYGKKRALGSLVSFASAYSWSQKQLLASLELPYAIADTEGKILWMNRAFEAVTKEEKSAGKSLTMLFKEITVESLEKMENAMEVHVIYGESKYRVSMKRVTIRPDELASGSSGRILLPPDHRHGRGPYRSLYGHNHSSGCRYRRSFRYRYLRSPPSRFRY